MERKKKMSKYSANQSFLQQKTISHYSQIHEALQQIPAHSTLELCLWLVSSRQGYNITRWG